jgi:nicotine oxidoreductase
MQSSKIFTNLSGSIRNFSTGPEKLTNLDIKQEIECSYKQLFDINIFKSAYQILKSNQGNMTFGLATDQETLDGLGYSLDWAYKTIQELKDRTFQFKPSLRVHIPKPNGKTRPLGIPSPRDQVIQQVFKLILEPIYEPIFSKLSHGFRPNKSTITAIYEVRK